MSELSLWSCVFSVLFAYQMIYYGFCRRRSFLCFYFANLIAHVLASENVKQFARSMMKIDFPHWTIRVHAHWRIPSEAFSVCDKYNWWWLSMAATAEWWFKFERLCFQDLKHFKSNRFVLLFFFSSEIFEMQNMRVLLSTNGKQIPKMKGKIRKCSLVFHISLVTLGADSVSPEFSQHILCWCSVSFTLKTTTATAS